VDVFVPSARIGVASCALEILVFSAQSILAFVMLAVLLTPCSQAHALGEKRIADRKGVLAVGGLSIGAKFKSLPAIRTKSEQCVENFKRPYFDCEYVGVNGALYAMIGKRLARIVVPDVQAFIGPLPASIQRSDKLTGALKKLKAQTTCATCCAARDYNDLGGESIVCGDYFVSKSGDKFGLDFDFDSKGKLTRIVSMTITN
jgi:hypothetical protein